MGHVVGSIRLWLCLAVLWCLTGTPGAAQIRPVQSEPALPETSVETALYHLSLRAAYVFVGTVETIDRGPGVVEVGLRVDRVLLGDPGSHYVLREWAGRWPPGLSRYTIGQCALFFLPAPGPSGLSAPVGGSAGVIPVHGDPNNADAVPVLDTRWLSANLERKIGDPLPADQPMTLGKAAEAITQGALGGTRKPPNPLGPSPLPILRENAPQARAARGAHGAR